ncbi:MAG: hypothetical protein NVS2B12_41670 [Ktedonobacteraceae bacterium]
MNHIQLNDLLTNVTNATIDDTEIDELFSCLGNGEPPIDMVANIMHAVAQLPQPKSLSVWKDLDFIELDVEESHLC